MPPTELSLAMARCNLHSVSGRVRYARLLRGMSTRAAALMAGLSPGAVSVIESREGADGRCGTVLALASAMDIDPAWLAWGHGERPVTAARASHDGDARRGAA